MPDANVEWYVGDENGQTVTNISNLSLTYFVSNISNWNIMLNEKLTHESYYLFQEKKRQK